VRFYPQSTPWFLIFLAVNQSRVAFSAIYPGRSVYISPTKLKLSMTIKICDIIILGSLVAGGAI
jgi:hypothetical protein